MVVHTVADSTANRSARGPGWALPLLPIALSVFCLSALAYYHVQVGGTDPADGGVQAAVVALYDFLGFVPAAMLFLLVLAWSSTAFITGERGNPWMRAARLAALTLSLAILVNLAPEGAPPAPDGGMLGAFLAVRFQSVLGLTLSTVVVSLVAVASLVLATDFFFYRYFAAAGRGGAGGSSREESGVENEVAQELKNLSFGERAEPRPQVSAEAVGLKPMATAAAAAAEWPEEGEGDDHDAVALAADEEEEPEAGELEEAEDLEDEGLDEEELEAEDPEDEEDLEAEDLEDEEELEDEDPEDEEELEDEDLEDEEPWSAEEDPEEESEEEPEEDAPEPAEVTKQGVLFPQVASLAEAAQLVIHANRASVTFLQRRLRVSYDEARELLESLRARGVVDGDAGDSRGRVRMDAETWAAAHADHGT